MSEDARPPPDEERDEGAPTDEEQVELEWYLWLVGLVAIAGAALVLFPPENWPNVGIVLLVLAVLGWVSKELLERTME